MSWEEKRKFYVACEGNIVKDAEGEYVLDAEGKQVWRADTEKVKVILAQVKPEQLLQLLLWKDKYGDTGQDVCLITKDEECIRTVVKHVLDTQDVKTLTAVLTVVFPYAGFVKSTDLVSGILQIVPNTRELLKAKTNESKQTALELCVVNNNVEHIRTIAEHIMENDPALLSIVFPYTGYITSTNITRRILDNFRDQSETLLKSLDFKGMSCLHVACDSGNKEAVIALLPELKNKCILKKELLRPDKTGRMPLCLAQAEQKQQWTDRYDGWEVVESDRAFQGRQDTATAMRGWIKQHAPDILDEVKKWLVLLSFYKGFNNLRERTSRFRHFYLARRAQIRT